MKYPANNYVLVLWNHGGGISIGYGFDEMFPDDDLSPLEIAGALKGSGVHLDLVIFDACLMATLEMAHAIAPYADYMIASEESMYTDGLFAHKLVEAVDRNPQIRTESLGKIIIDTYIQGMYESMGAVYGTPVNLSLIDLSQMGGVYDAMCHYLRNARQEIIDLNLTEYLIARENCGAFEAVDCVDIVSFAKEYVVQGAEELVQAVDDAVIYTQGNIYYANGLSFYAPSMAYAEEYMNTSRDVLYGDSYGKSIRAFFDTMLSAASGYQMTANQKELRIDPGTPWYDGRLAMKYQNLYESYGGIPSELVDGVRIVGHEWVEDHYALVLSEEAWDIVSLIETRLQYHYEEDYEEVVLILGSDNIWELDEYDNIDLSFPTEWLFIDGQMVEYVVLYDYSSEDGYWSTYGAVPAYKDGDQATLIYLVPYWTSDSEEPTMIGYYRMDPVTLEYMDGDTYLYPVRPGDSYTFVYQAERTNMQTGEVTSELMPLGGNHVVGADGFSISYEDARGLQTLLPYELVGFTWIQLTDIYGNEYETEGFTEEVMAGG